MERRRTSALDVREMIRRFRLGEKDRQIARDLGVARNTVAGYRQWAKQQNLLEGSELPDPAAIEQALEATTPAREPGPASCVEKYRAIVVEKREKGVEMKALLRILREHGFEGSYSALRRFVKRIERRAPDTFVRVETAPGQEAQVDFGYVGEFFDLLSGQWRKAWVFVMTLSFSRHQYVEIVFDQKVETWIDLHIRAFEAFGGCVERVVIDNLKAGIVKAVVHDAQAQRSYRELAEHYGFLISPCRPRTARLKGKVESGVRYVKRNALAGRTFASVQEANDYLGRWVKEVAGERDHGTTHEPPLVRFEEERPALRPLPQSRYEIVVWKRAKLHPDCHVVFEYSYYSAPYRLVGQELWIRATPRRVEIYHDFERTATHPRATRKGQRLTIEDHLPPEKIEGLLAEPVRIRSLASKVGAATAELIDHLLGERPLDRLRTAQAILGLGRRHGLERLEAACRRALAFNDTRYHTIRRILKDGYDLEPVGPVEAGPLPKTAVFARSITELAPARVN